MCAPPVGGLGNFKGVMLCNRPTDLPAASGGAPTGPQPFKSMVSATQGEQLGLPPSKALEGERHAVKKRGPSAALRQHVKWLRELQGQMRGERDQVEEDDRQCDDRKRRVREAVGKHREAVRQMMEERTAAAKDSAVDAVRPQPSKNGGKTKKVVRPLWSLTEEEREKLEEEECDGLLDFAEGLDYEKFLGDGDFRRGVEALKDRAGHLAKEQDAFKDALVAEFNAKLDEDDPSTSCGSPRSSIKLEDGVDGQSILGDLRSEYSAGSSADRSAGGKRYGGQAEWDASTCCSDERSRVDPELRDAATRVLESAPQIKAVHSKGSVQRIIERQQKAKGAWEPNEPANIIEAMNRDGLVPAPVISRSEDTTHVLQKAVDPSNLPYLYRSPAI